MSVGSKGKIWCYSSEDEQGNKQKQILIMCYIQSMNHNDYEQEILNDSEKSCYQQFSVMEILFFAVSNVTRSENRNIPP